MSEPDPIVPEDKDWTWVLSRPCPECGYDAAAVEQSDLAEAIRSSASGWGDRLDRDDATTRPNPTTWSPTEYAAHIRDVNRIFAERVRLMLAEDGPTFPNWDQDAAAIENDYAHAEPAVVAADLVAAADECAAVYAGVTEWDRVGYRSNGSNFTIDSIGRYQLHDLVHHRWDCGVTS